MTELKDLIEQLKNIDLFDELLDILRTLIKEDDFYASMVLMHAFSAYTPEPMNLLSQAPTSEGKTYPIVTVLSLFPREDVWFLGGLSPTAIAHDHGTLILEDTGAELEPILQSLQEEYESTKDKRRKREIKREIRELLRRAAIRVDLENKILFFMDNPNQETLNRLRPILSHDTWEISYKFTDRRKGGPLQTMHVKVRGWPAALAALTKGSKDVDTWEQLVSRFTTISPKQSREKYREAVRLVAMKRGLPEPVLNEALSLSRFEWARKAIGIVITRLKLIREKARTATGKPNPNIFWIPFYRHIGEEFPASVGRHMRDSQRFMTALQMSAAINVYARPILRMGDMEAIIVTRADYERAVKLYFEGEQGESIFTGLPDHVLKFFHGVVLPLWRERRGKGGILIEEMRTRFPEVFGKTISSKALQNHYLPPLIDVGLVDKEPYPDDKRLRWYKVLREEVVENLPNSSFFGNGLNFGLEELREAWNELIEKIPREMCIKIDFHGEELSIEDLFYKFMQSRSSMQEEKQFLHTPPREIFSIPEKTRDSTEKSLKTRSFDEREETGRISLREKLFAVESWLAVHDHTDIDTLLNSTEIEGSEILRLLSVLEREDKVFQPRPNVYELSHPPVGFKFYCWICGAELQGYAYLTKEYRLICPTCWRELRGEVS